MSLTPADDHTTIQLQRALQSLREMRARLEQVEKARTEPIAIVGMACRVPGANNLAEYWDLLRDGVDAISETPVDRWENSEFYDSDPQAPGKAATRWGGFLDEIDRFDAGFFGISPREAAQMDPQQRLLLEAAYEALEDAGHPVESLAGTRTGVFIGVHSQSNDYYLLQSAEPSNMDLYSGTGTSHSVLAGRLSYLFDFRGPCLAVDTACSSSLVGIHQAVQSLRQRESDLALAGGVNLLLDPTFSIAASRMQMLAADGRCKTFDAAANGFVRSEGCGVVILKRLSDALANADRIHAVVYGSAVNQDGNSNGLTAPNGLAQQDVIKKALRDAGVSPGEIGYVEAHGTGTPLGDPIEVEALATTLGPPDESTSRCLLGSAKANLGHLEGAAGVAGLIKAVLTLNNQLVPILPHFETLNPLIDLINTRLEIPTEPTPWPANEETRYAGVSSFGWSGTNAHVILGDPPLTTKAEQPESGPQGNPVLLPISAKTRPALRAMAASYATRFRDDSAPPLADLAFTAATRRSQLSERLAVVGENCEQICDRLMAFASNQPAAGIVHSTASERPPRLAFVFPGQGGQWLGMGLQLAATEPFFAAALERCDGAIKSETGWSLTEVLNASPGNSRFDEISVVQPAIFAMQVALAELLADWGLNPDVVVGHSLGEIAAAHVAGILSLEDAVAVICRRSRILSRVAGQGAMGIVGLPLAEAEALVLPYKDQLSVAASNGPATTLLSGAPNVLDEVISAVEQSGGFARRVQVDVASHSPQMEPLLPALSVALAGIRPQTARVEFASTVTGSALDGRELDASYWGRNLQQPVLFGPTITRLIEAGETAFLEISPHPVLQMAIADTLQSASSSGIAVGALRREHDEAATLREAVGALWATGIKVNWNQITPGKVVLPLPGYPWQHERYWFTSKRSKSRGRIDRVPAKQMGESLLGAPLPDLANLPGYRFWQGSIGPPDIPDSLETAGVPILDGSHAAVMVTDALAAVSGGAIVELDVEPQLLNSDSIEMQLLFCSTGEMKPQIQLHLRANGGDQWLRWAAAAETDKPDDSRRIDVRQLRSAMTRVLDHVPGMKDVWRNENESIARTERPTAGDRGRVELIAAACNLLRDGSSDGAALFTAASRVVLSENFAETVWVYSIHRDAGENDGDLLFLDEEGKVVAEILDIQLAPASENLLRNASFDRLGDRLYIIEWTVDSRPVDPPPVPGRWLILSRPGGPGEQLAGRLTAAGGRATVFNDDDPNLRSTFIQFHQELKTDGRSLDGIIDLRPLEAVGIDTPEIAEEQCNQACELIQEVARARFNRSPKVWIVTRGAQPVDGPPRCSASAALWGFGQVVTSEHPEFWGGLVDLDPHPDEAEAELLYQAIFGSSNEQHLAVRGNKHYVQRLKRRSNLLRSPVGLRDDGAYLITGGAGGIGLAIARSMVDAGVRHLALMGRRPLDDDIASAIDQLENAGASVSYFSGDVSNIDDVESTLEVVSQTMPPLRGVVHAAGTLADATILQQTPASIHAVMKPKVAGANNLATIAQNLELDFVVFFSSASAFLGTPGQSNYAAANAVLDSYAQRLASQGVRATSIAWGRWGEVGLATSDESALNLDRLGIRPMPTQDGVVAFENLVGSTMGHIAVLDINWQTFLERDGIGSSLYEEFIAGDPNVVTGSPDSHGELRTLLGKSRAEERSTLLLGHVRALSAAVMRFDGPAHILPGQGFFQIGMDSLTAVELKNRLQHSLGITLPATVAFDFPTPSALAQHLLTELFPVEAAQTSFSESNSGSNGIAQLSPDELRAMLDEELTLIDEDLG